MGVMDEGSPDLVDFLRRENLVLVRRERWGEALGKEQAAHRVRVLAERAAATPPPPRRWIGWCVERPDGSSSFGTFDRRDSAERCLEQVTRSLCPEAVITESYIQDPADTSVVARVVLAALDGVDLS